MNDVAIAVRSVSKCYRVYANERARLRHLLFSSSTAGVSEVWALRDVSFEVKRGDSVGIIGRNGSGKTTLLEIITRTLTPTSGEVQVTGRVAALLELGSGFNPEYSGRENVFLNGLLLGLTRTEVEERFDEIAAFADIGDVLDRPVRTYSSGMLVRLAFAVQVALDPEILIVDEALSVGDFFFQQKCFARLREMRERGLTLLFVSHDMKTIRDLCQAAVYLRDGSVQYVGAARVAVQRFLHEGAAPASGSGPATVDRPHSTGESGPPHSLLAELRAHGIWSRPGAPGQPTEAGTILAVATYDETGTPTAEVVMGQDLFVRVAFVPPEGFPGQVALGLRDRFDRLVTVTGSAFLGVDVPTPPAGDATVLVLVLEIAMTMLVEAGGYSLVVTLGQPKGPNIGTPLDQTPHLGPIQVRWNYVTTPAPFLGLVGLPARASYIYCG
ncbi:MAG: ABC transporter ATP-binding protein [Candidatus Latescibacterota bacterium]|jgi:lipopolysaccharide transport system ATP-binding protein